MTERPDDRRKRRRGEVAGLALVIAAAAVGLISYFRLLGWLLELRG